MNVIKALSTAVLVLILAMVGDVTAYGVTLTAGNVLVDKRVSHYASVAVTVDDPTEITGAAFSLVFDTQALDLVEVESDFFPSFINQYASLPGVGTPFVNPADGKTYLPITIGAETFDLPAGETIGGESYYQPVIVGPETAIGHAIAATKLQPGGQNNVTLFILTFDVGNAPSGNYPINIEQTTINFSEAGYDAGGENIAMLTGALTPSAGDDLTNPAVFPQIPVETVNSGRITVTSTIDLAITNKPAQTLTVPAGDRSEVFTVSGGDDRQYTWTITNSRGQVVDTHIGSSYVFNAPVTGPFAGVYTVEVVDYLGFADSFAIKVPPVITPASLSFTEVKLDGAPNPQTFTVAGADGDYVWEILASATAAAAVSNPDNYGNWEVSSPVPSVADNVFNPADVTTWLSFYIRVTVENDAALTAENGLDTVVAGPFTLLPVDTYRVTLRDDYGVIDGTALNTGDITVEEISTTQIKSDISAAGVASFLLPDAGATYQYRVMDNRTPSVYMERLVSSGAKAVSILLESESLDAITGFVGDTAGAPVGGATVVAYQPENPTVQYKATSIADGTYRIKLPVTAPQNGWSLIASHPAYLAQRLDNQAVGVVDFTGTFSLYGATSITNVTASKIGETVRIDITANPPIMDVSEVAAIISSGSGNLSQPFLSSNIEADATVTYVYDRDEEFEIMVTADTSEDYNPHTGYAASQTLTYVSDLTALSKVYLGSTGGGATLQANNQSVSVNIPPGGIDGDIYVTIEQYVSSGRDAKIHPYVYDISAYDNLTETKVPDSAIHYLEITLPIDLSLVSPGDLENEKWVIRHAKDLIALQAGNGRVENNSVIISTDYVGDGQRGSVTFHVNSLSVFEVAASAGAVPAPGSGSNLAGLAPELGVGGCFIATTSTGSFTDLFHKFLRRLMSGYNRLAD
jgi:hypothetical protein